MKPYIGQVTTLGAPPTGDVKPDSITTDGHTTFVEYANTSKSDGSGGSSQIVQYDKRGNVLATYDVAGSVDGLKFNANNGLLYALQNQDGNSTLTLIDPATGAQSTPIAYGNPSPTQGYDDIVFDGHQTFLSYTNPSNPSDPIISKLARGNTPFGPLQVTPVLLEETLGYNTVTHQAQQVIPASDPDSLKLTPSGDLLLSSGADGTIIDVHNPGKADQYASFTQITDAQGNAASGVDDVIKPSASSGTFTLVDTANNTVQTFKATNLNQSSYYASVSSLGGFGQVNAQTGVFTLLVPASGAHGLSFQPSTGHETGTFTYTHQENAAADAARSQAAPILASSAQLAATLLDGSASATATLSPPVDAGTGSAIVANHLQAGLKLHG